MNIFINFSRHKGLLAFSVIAFIFAISITLVAGVPSPFHEIEWSDVVGEGCIALLTIAWIVAALASRPAGPVTRLLTIGLSCFMFSALLDMMDEFVDYPPSAHWISMMESLPAAVGMVVMSIALFRWHGEQLSINRQLKRRELLLRAHEQIDFITQLYSGSYWQERVLQSQQTHDSNILVVLDINDFSSANMKFGSHECDRYLREIAQIIVMNIGEDDLTCRYAGDRFAILIPNATLSHGLQIAHHITTSIRHVAFKSGPQDATIYHTVRTACHELKPQEPLPEIMIELNRELDKNKRIAA